MQRVLWVFTTLMAAVALLASVPSAIAQRAAPPGGASAQVAVGTAFTYQGRLTDGGSSATGSYDFQFSLFDADSSGTQAGNTVTLSGVPVANGLFTVQLDFGSAFTGEARWLQIGVRATGTNGEYTTLSPRQPVTPAPYALYAVTAGSVPGTVKYRRTVVASPIGTAAENGTALRNALAGIAGAAADNKYLLKIEPGTYDVGSTGLVMVPYVDIEGSGELTTYITSTGSSLTTSGTVHGASHAELRFLTVENDGGGASVATAIANFGAVPRLTNVTAYALGSTAFSNAILNYDHSHVLMTNVTAGATGSGMAIGVRNDASNPDMTNVRITVSGAGTSGYGVYSSGYSSVRMTNSSVYVEASPTLYGVANYGRSSTSMEHGSISAMGDFTGTIYGAYNDLGSVYLQNASVAAYGGATTYGIFNAPRDGSLNWSSSVSYSTIQAMTRAVQNDSDSSISISLSSLYGGVAGSRVTCAGVSSTYPVAAFYNTTCPQ